ncbi:hypothetical protein HG530_015673 [Fusarium avenaceum]|nr:hypothetical protein HG530_015673 [Fusarium avenaceum]
MHSTPTKVGIDNSSAPESPTPKGLSLSLARNLSHEQSGTVPALESMVKALKSEIEEAMAEMQAIWDEMALENACEAYLEPRSYTSFPTLFELLLSRQAHTGRLGCVKHALGFASLLVLDLLEALLCLALTASLSVELVTKMLEGLLGIEGTALVVGVLEFDVWLVSGREELSHAS